MVWRWWFIRLVKLCHSSVQHGGSLLSSSQEHCHWRDAALSWRQAATQPLWLVMIALCQQAVYMKLSSQAVDSTTCLHCNVATCLHCNVDKWRSQSSIPSVTMLLTWLGHLSTLQCRQVAESKQHPFSDNVADLETPPLVDIATWTSGAVKAASLQWQCCWLGDRTLPPCWSLHTTAVSINF